VETEKAIKQMNFGKAFGMNGIPTELYKVVDEDSLQVFQEFPETFSGKDMQKYFWDASVVPIKKRKRLLD
jgi:hypothetical protein